MKPEIIGLQLDACGRCRHYHKPEDVVALWCQQCQAYYACYQCHDALCNHTFVPSSTSAAKVLCGVCRHELTYAQYVTGRCPNCRQKFNPRCALHHSRYFCD
ncbi:CHY zinc finger protein [Lacticaseibacillus jixiensis]|uniref:CHY zinc finger protein n=1 Tax=Lacticaseibacillus jixiensis TaxID=3231926 RepID=UPI0036F3EE70